MKTKRGQQRRPPPKQPSARQLRIEGLRRLARSAWSATKSLLRLPWWADVLSVVAFCFFLYQIYNAFVPVVQPDAAISSSSLDLPMTVRNAGDFFSMKDVEFFCDMTEQQFAATDEMRKTSPYNYYRIIGFIEWGIGQPPITIRPGSTTSFPCNIAARSLMNFDSAPMPVKLIRLSIRTQYQLDFRLFQWHRQAKSQTFTWSQVSGGWQWLPGETMSGLTPN